MTVAALLIVLLVVLIGPLLFKPIEQNLDIFFLAAGTFAALVSGQFGWGLVRAAAAAPVALTAAVLVFDAILMVVRQPLDRGFEALQSLVSTALDLRRPDRRARRCSPASSPRWLRRWSWWSSSNCSGWGALVKSRSPYSPVLRLDWAPRSRL